MSLPKISRESRDKKLIEAAWIFPMTSAPIRDGALVIGNGKLLDLGLNRDVFPKHPDAQRVDLKDHTLLPGLVNAHTHLELSLMKQPPAPPPGGFVEWIKQVMTSAPRDESVAKAVQAGIDQCLTFGVTCIGDISRQCQISRPVLKSSAVRAISFGEIQAMATRRGLLEERLQRAADVSCQTDRLYIGLSPHAPYSVDANGYRRCLESARANQMPLCTHLAENGFEREFLSDHSGPFRDLWTWLNAWDDQVLRFPGGPIRFAQSLGLLDYPTLLAHVNYCDDDELEILSRGQAAVVFCPRTHRYFSHPPHRWREMLERGLNVVLGTDSCASSPDLNLLEEARLLHREHPDFATIKLLEMITNRAADALGIREAGRLEIGHPTDIIAFPTQTSDPSREILEMNLPAELIAN